MTTKTPEVIIITGASRGVGQAVARILAGQGMSLVLVARHIENSITNQTLSISADITKESDCKKVIDTALQKFGRIDALINNAGVFLDKPLDKISESEYKTLMDTNVFGTFLMSKAVIPQMKKQKSGLILNMGSKISHNSNVSPNKVLYATSKYAIEGFSNSLAKELQPFGIRVTCLMPATINTFFSLRSRNFLSTDRIGEIISLVIRLKEVEFESILFKSIKQNI